MPALIGDRKARLYFDQVNKAHPRTLAAIREHYPKSRTAPVGRVIIWQITENSKIIGHIGLGDPVLRLAARNRLGIGARFLPETVCVFFYRIQDQRRSEASTILQLWHPIARIAWFSKYGTVPVHWETFVDPAMIREKNNPGACFKRAGYRTLGFTSGAGFKYMNSLRGVDSSATSAKILLYRGPLPRIGMHFCRKLGMFAEPGIRTYVADC